MSFPTKVQREQCWGAKDKLWQCLDKNEEKVDACVNFRKEYEKYCSNQWVKHFDRRRQYEKFKSQMESENWEDPLEANR